MPILRLLERVREQQPAKAHPFLTEQRPLQEAYILGVGMQAYVDGKLDDTEKAYLKGLADAFQIDNARAETLIAKAQSADESIVKLICDNLGKTKFAYYFIVDLQIMAHQDRQVCDRELRVIKVFAELLDIDNEDVVFLTELADAVASDDREAKDRWVQSFFESMREHQGLRPETFDYYTTD
jgi:uncharacterized tellurite resistance protein B-like protein